MCRIETTIEEMCRTVERQAYQIGVYCLCGKQSIRGVEATIFVDESRQGFGQEHASDGNRNGEQQDQTEGRDGTLAYLSYLAPMVEVRTAVCLFSVRLGLSQPIV